MSSALGRPLILASSHDVELAALAAAGDRAAFGELVRRHGLPVRGLLRRLGADPGSADRIAQDAFLAAFEQIAEFRGEGPFQAWVRRIAARLYVKRCGKDVRADLMAPTPERPGGTGPPGLDDEGPATDRVDLDLALDDLSRIERLCVGLCYGAGLSHAEAAQALNAPSAVVKSHVKHGLDKLRSRLTANGRGGRPEGEGHG